MSYHHLSSFAETASQDVGKMPSGKAEGGRGEEEKDMLLGVRSTEPSRTLIGLVGLVVVLVVLVVLVVVGVLCDEDHRSSHRSDIHKMSACSAIPAELERKWPAVLPDSVPQKPFGLSREKDQQWRR